MQILLSLILAAAASPGTAAATTDSPAPATLSLDRFVATVLANNPGVQRIRAQEEIVAGQLLASQGIGDPVIGAMSSLGRVEPDGVSPFEPNRSYDAALGLSVDYLVAETGTRAGLSYGGRFTDRLPGITGLGTDYFQPSVTLRLTQPLLKNRWGIQDRLDLRVTELAHELAGLEVKEQLESYITALAALYLDWYLAHREVTISEEVYRQALAQEKLIRLKVSRQVAEAHELFRAQEAREDYYARWQQALGGFEGLSRRIETQMLASFEAPQVPIDPGDGALLAPSSVPAAYLATASRLKLILDIVAKQQGVVLDARDNALEADLSLSLLYSRHGIDPNFVAAHAGSLDHNDVMLLLDYRFPVGNRRAQGAYQAELARRRQIRADTAQRLLDAQAIRASLEAQEKRMLETLSASDRKIALAERKLKEERRLYSIGRLDSFELIQDQKAQLETRLIREQRYVQLQQLRLSLGELLDQNLVRAGGEETPVSGDDRP